MAQKQKHYHIYAKVSCPRNYTDGMRVWRSSQSEWRVVKPPDALHPYYVRSFVRANAWVDYEMGACWMTQAEFETLEQRGEDVIRSYVDRTVLIPSIARALAAGGCAVGE